MKVLLKEDVHNLGYSGEVMSVADGYGRNYLIPRGLAVKATPGVLKEARAWRERAAVRLEELRAEHEALSSRISETHLNFTARAGETGKLYGSVTTMEIIEQLNEALGTDLERRTIATGPLRQLGEHKVAIRLSRDYHPQVTVHIHPFAEEPEETEEASLDSAEDVEEETVSEEEEVEDGEETYSEEPQTGENLAEDAIVEEELEEG